VLRSNLGLILVATALCVPTALSLAPAAEVKAVVKLLGNHFEEFFASIDTKQDGEFDIDELEAFVKNAPEVQTVYTRTHSHSPYTDIHTIHSYTQSFTIH
jgi:hypothetical protein